MALSERERRILRELEQQFPTEAGPTGTDRRRRLGRWHDRAGWLLLVVGSIAAIGLLMTAVVASFVSILVAAVGLWLLATGATGRALRSRFWTRGAQRHR